MTFLCHARVLHFSLKTFPHPIASLEHIASAGKGVVVLIGQEVSPEQALAEVIQFPEPPSVTGPADTTGQQNYRVIGTGSQILKRLGVGKMKLMSAPKRWQNLI